MKILKLSIIGRNFNYRGHLDRPSVQIKYPKWRKLVVLPYWNNGVRLRFDNPRGERPVPITVGLAQRLWFRTGKRWG